MPLMNWDASLSVGVSLIDTQHKKLVELVNKLYDAMKAGKSKDVLGPILDELIAYTASHFKTEEKYFDDFKYEGILAHKEEHKKLVAQVLDFQGKFKSGAASISIELMKFLQDWLVNHIKGTDKKYTKCFNDHGLK